MSNDRSKLPAVTLPKDNLSFTLEEAIADRVSHFKSEVETRLPKPRNGNEPTAGAPRVDWKQSRYKTRGASIRDDVACSGARSSAVCCHADPDSLAEAGRLRRAQRNRDHSPRVRMTH